MGGLFGKSKAKESRVTEQDKAILVRYCQAGAIAAGRLIPK